MNILKNLTDADNPTYDLICVGAGATGSHFISFVTQLLANNDEHSLTIIDQDKVEHKNLKNQKFLPKDADLNRYKAETLAERYSKVYPNINVFYHNTYIKSLRQIRDIVDNRPNDKSIPVIIGCVDNNPSRVILSDLFNQYRGIMVYIDCGNGDEMRVGQTVVAIKTIKSKTYYNREFVTMSEPVADVFKEIREDKTDINKILSCSYVSESKPQNIGSNIMSATALYTVINNMISFNDIPCTRIIFDAEQCTFVSRTILKKKEKKKKDEKKAS